MFEPKLLQTDRSTAAHAEKDDVDLYRKKTIDEIAELGTVCYYFHFSK